VRNVRQAVPAGVTVSNMTTAPAAAARMSRRSWYLPSDIAEELARIVDELHWSTHRPKREIIAAAFAVAIEHRADIEARLTDTDGES
jgi:hypothetical protein